MKEAPEGDERRGVEQTLSDEILSDARRKAERTVSHAELSVKDGMEKAAREAETVRQEVLRQAQETIDRERQVFDSSLRLEERMRRLKAQSELLEGVFVEALKSLVGRTFLSGNDEDRQEGLSHLVKRLAVEAVLALNPAASEFVVHLPKGDLESMKDTFGRELAAAVRSASTGRDLRITVVPMVGASEVHGVIVGTADGHERVDNTFVARLARMKEEIRFDVAKLLFAEEEPTG